MWHIPSVAGAVYQVSRWVRCTFAFVSGGGGGGAVWCRGAAAATAREGDARYFTVPAIERVNGWGSCEGLRRVWISTAY